MKKINAVYKTRRAPGFTELREVSLPELKPDQVLVKVKQAGICGSDIHHYDWVGISYVNVVFAAILPAILFYLSNDFIKRQFCIYY